MKQVEDYTNDDKIFLLGGLYEYCHYVDEKLKN